MEPDTDQTQPAKHRTTIQIVAGAATILIALVIAVLTLTPSVSPPPTRLALSDKIYHAIAFASLLFPAAAAYPTFVLRIAGAAFAYGA